MIWYRPEMPEGQRFEVIRDGRVVHRAATEREAQDFVREVHGPKTKWPKLRPAS